MPPIDPDRQNVEQDDTASQAQTVADEALFRGERPREGEGNVHGGRPDPTRILPDDAQDVVDHMTDMDNSGRIDTDAFDGEENMDDEDGSVPDYGGEPLPDEGGEG
ncbi:MAG: hypothetical protein J7498_15355 [Sphingobium sp.]|nr:hypothetical protein [Sphingobium sp.]